MPSDIEKKAKQALAVGFHVLECPECEACREARAIAYDAEDESG